MPEPGALTAVAAAHPDGTAMSQWDVERPQARAGVSIQLSSLASGESIYISSNTTINCYSLWM
jgi:hypothetical protein